MGEQGQLPQSPKCMPPVSLLAGKKRGPLFAPHYFDKGLLLYTGDKLLLTDTPETPGTRSGRAKKASGGRGCGDSVKKPTPFVGANIEPCVLHNPFAPLNTPCPPLPGPAQGSPFDKQWCQGPPCLGTGKGNLCKYRPPLPLHSLRVVDHGARCVDEMGQGGAGTCRRSMVMVTVSYSRPLARAGLCHQRLVPSMANSMGCRLSMCVSSQMSHCGCLHPNHRFGNEDSNNFQGTIAAFYSKHSNGASKEEVPHEDVLDEFAVALGSPEPARRIGLDLAVRRQVEDVGEEAALCNKHSPSSYGSAPWHRAEGPFSRATSSMKVA